MPLRQADGVFAVSQQGGGVEPEAQTWQVEAFDPGDRGIQLILGMDHQADAVAVGRFDEGRSDLRGNIFGRKGQAQRQAAEVGRQFHSREGGRSGSVDPVSLGPVAAGDEQVDSRRLDSAAQQEGCQVASGPAVQLPRPEAHRRGIELKACKSMMGNVLYS